MSEASEGEGVRMPRIVLMRPNPLTPSLSPRGEGVANLAFAQSGLRFAKLGRRARRESAFILPLPGGERSSERRERG